MLAKIKKKGLVRHLLAGLGMGVACPIAFVIGRAGHNPWAVIPMDSLFMLALAGFAVGAGLSLVFGE